MRTVYLIRHGRPDFPDDKPMCLGTTDLPLGPLGRLQSALVGAVLQEKGVRDVFCSQLSRSRQTAQLISDTVTEAEGLEELSSGEWDGLSFEEIRERWPELYARRGEDPSIQPPGSSSRELGQRRFALAMERLMSLSTGDVAVVAHATVNQLFLCSILGLPLEKARELKLPYGSVTRLTRSSEGWAVGEIGVCPHPPLDERLCLLLLSAYGTAAPVVAHCAAVAKESMRIVCALAAAGADIDENLVFAAAMLHDMARASEDHARLGAALIEQLGYGQVADAIGQHHELNDPGVLDEAAVVFIADKAVQDTERVTLEQRFHSSAEKCVTPEALAAHERRYAAAKQVADHINTFCGKDVIL